MKIDIHTHILPREWPDLDAKYGLNGWTKVNTRFFNPTKGIVAKIENSLGH